MPAAARRAVSRLSPIVLLLGVSLGIQAPRADALPTAGYLEAAPARAIAGESVTLQGRIPPYRVRPVVLQRKRGYSWVTVDRARTARTGRFAVRTRTRPITTTYRVLAPRARIGGLTYARTQTAGSTVTTLRQRATLTLPDTAEAGSLIAATASFRPARPERTVQLQRWTGGRWRVDDTSTQDPDGNAYFTFIKTRPGTYTYRAVAVWGNGAAAVESPASDITITDTTAPGPVTGLSVTDTTTDSVTLSWTNPTDADFTGVMIRRAPGPTPPATPTDGTLVTDTTSSATTHTDPGLDPATEYSYALFAHDAIPNHATAATATATTKTPPPPPDTTAPGPVTGLSVTDTTTDSVTLSWTNPTDADFTGVMIRRAPGPTPPATPTDGTLVTDTTSSATTHTDPGLDPATEYSYALFAHDAIPNHATAATATATTKTPPPPPDTTAPGPVTGLSVTDTTTDSVTLSWTNPTDADFTGVMIRRAPGPTPPATPTDGTLVTDTTSSATTHTDPGLDPATEYSYALFAHDAIPNHATAATATATTKTPPPPPDTTAPGSVTGLSVTDTTTDSVTLSWTNPTDADFTGVMIRRAPGPTPPATPTDGTLVTDTTSSATTHTDPGLDPATEYSYALFAHDAIPNHATAATATATTKTPPPPPDTTAPGPVTGLSVTDTTTDSVTLSWTNPTDADFTGVMIRRAPGPTPPATPTDGTLVTDTTSSATTHTDPGLDPATEYSYALFAHDAIPNHATAATATATTKTPPPPPDTTAPGPVTGLSVTDTTTDSVTLSWTNPTDADFTGVMIRRAPGPTPPATPTDGTLVTDTTSSATTHTDPGLDPATEYSYALFAHDAIPNHATAATATATTKTPPPPPDTTAPGPVTGLSVTDTTTDSVTLSWTNPTDADFTGVMIRRAPGATPPATPTDGTLVTDTTSSATTHTDPGLDPATEYSYALFAHDAIPNHATAATATATTKTPPPPPDTTAPGPVTGLSVTDTTTDSVTLSWTNPTDADFTGVMIRRAPGATPPATPTDGTLVTDTTASATSHTDPGLDPSTEYSYALFAHDAIPNHATAATATATTAPEPNVKRFVQGVSANGRYFVDQKGDPILVKGDSPWAILLDASEAQMDLYVSTRAAQGFNTVLLSLLGNQGNGGPSNDGATYDGLLPFVGGDPSVLNDAYWNRVEYFLGKCRDAGITVMAYPIDGWTGVAENNGLAKDWSVATAEAYGKAVAARLSGYENVIWSVGGDYNSDDGPDDARQNAVLTGLADGGMDRISSVQFTTNSTSLSSAYWADKVDYNFVYSYAPTYTMVESGYQRTNTSGAHRPALLGETHYEAYGGLTDLYLRSQAAWALTSGSPGELYGSEDVWDAAPTKEALNTTAVAQLSALRTAFEGLRGWQNLVPDYSSRFITDGRGTKGTDSEDYVSGNTYVTGGITDDGTLAVVYLPDATGTITLNTDLMGPGYTARWIDPTTGASTPASAGPTYTHPDTNAAGSTDWLLVLEASTP